MSTAQFTTPLIVVIPGQIIAASLWNNEFTNNFNNLNTDGIGAHSDTDVQMQTATDPFPSGTSRPTSVSGELERIRYILQLIIGQTYWYQHPETDLHTLSTETPAIPVGTVMSFFQAAAPTGWTQVVTQNDKALRVVSGVGGGSGGSVAFSTSLAHTHTVASHTHDLANHTHDLANHTHTGAAHTHTVPRDSWGSSSATVSGRLLTNSGSPTSSATADNTSGSTTPGASSGPSSNTSGTPSSNTSGAATPVTDSQLGALAYIDMILASKN